MVFLPMEMSFNMVVSLNYAFYRHNLLFTLYVPTPTYLKLISLDSALGRVSDFL